MNLKNKIAVVTGASSGLGLATAQKLIEKGAIVYGIARNEEKLNEIKLQSGKKFHVVVLDICSETAINNWVKQTFSNEYFPQILVNNAGFGQFCRVDELPSEKWHAMIDTNLSAVHFMTAAIVPFMKKDDEISYIINIGSVLGKVSGSLKSAYSATKFALQGYSEALFKELRNFNIKVSCFNPGSINTGFFENSGIKKNNSMLKADELADILIFLLETPNNVLIDELTVRPLRPNIN